MSQNRHPKGAFITFEGIDGCGKSTAASMVYQILKKDGFPAVLTQEPTHTWLGDAVKRSTSSDSHPFTDLFLFMADRAEHTKQISEWLRRGRIVLCDRYMDSTIAYQGVTLKPYFGSDAERTMRWLVELHKDIAITPDRTYLLMLNPASAIRRISGRDKKIKYEKRSFLSEVQKNYDLLARAYARFVIIEAIRKPEHIAQMIADDIISIIGH